MIDHLVFDITSADTRAESHQVGAIIQGVRGGAKQLVNSQQINSLEWLNVVAAMFDGDGNKITSTDNALDVNLKSPLVVEVDVDGFYHVSNNPTPDSVGAIFHSRSDTLTLAEQVQRTTAGAIGAVDSADISKINAMDVNSFLYGINDDSGDAELLSISDDNGGLNVNISGGTVSVSDVALANAAIASKAETLDEDDVAQPVIETPLANRKYLWVHNFDNRRMFIGGVGVSAANGFPVSPGMTVEMRAGSAVPVNYVSPKINHAIRTLELS